MKKKLTAILLSLLMSVQMVPLFAHAEEAEAPTVSPELPEESAEQALKAAEAAMSEEEAEPVPFMFYNEATKSLKKSTCTDYVPLTSGMTELQDGKWYVADGTLTIGSRVSARGVTNLILKDNCNLTVTGGINVGSGVTLRIFAESDGDSMGTLTADARELGNFSGIGGAVYETVGTVEIHSGNVIALSGDSGAGIGSSRSGSGGTVKIFGGVVNATGTRNDGAGIGGGYESGSYAVEIYGGNVTANGGNNSAGIGSAGNGTCGTVKIFGGVVTATGNDYGAGIGGGYRVNGDVVEISGGKVTANGGRYDIPSIGGGRESSSHGSLDVGDTLSIIDNNSKQTIGLSDVPSHPSVCIFDPEFDPEPKAMTYREYVDGAFVTQTCKDEPFYPYNPYSGSSVWDESWYAADGLMTLENVTVRGDVNLILMDDCVLTVTNGINLAPGNSLTIYAQSEGEHMGILNAGNGETGNPAGIGGSYSTGGGTLTVHGGFITAKGANGAGIGGGINGAGGTFTIYGGNVTAVGGANASGIGGSGSRNCGGGTTVIYGGSVAARGCGAGAGIGGCDNTEGSVAIHGGTVVLEYDEYGRGISADNTVIDGGMVIDGEEMIYHDHIYTGSVYIDNNDGTHSRQCIYCDNILTESHTIENGECICGADEFVIDENGVLTRYNGNAETVCIPENVTKIGQAVFNKNGSIKEVTIPASVEVIDYKAFNSCGNLKTVNFAADSNLTTIGRESFTFSGLTSFTVPASVTFIGQSSVGGMKSLTSLTFEAGSQLKTIEGWAFNNDSLTTLDIPASVTQIGTSAFGINTFDSVTVHWTDEDAAADIEDCFSTETYNGATLHIPAGTGVIYEKHAVFGRFSNVDEPAVDHEHDFTDSYTINDDGTHSQRCNICHTSYREHHSFTDGVCVCGQTCESVAYLDYDEQSGALAQEECDTYTPLFDALTVWNDGQWYVADGQLTVNGVTVTGDAYLILKDGCELTVNGGITGTGHLHIYAQKEGSEAGTLECVSNGAAITLPSLSVFGGNVSAEAKNGAAGIDGTSLDVFGGHVSARGAKGQTDGGTGIEVTTLTVYGGFVEAFGGNGALSVSKYCGGTGIDAQELNMLGGTLEATGGVGGSGSDSDKDGNISTYGANAGDGGTGICVEKLTVTDGEITVTGGKGGKGGEGMILGGFRGGDGGFGGIGISVTNGIVRGGTVTVTGGRGGSGGYSAGTSGNGGVGLMSENTFVMEGGTVTVTGGHGEYGGSADGSTLNGYGGNAGNGGCGMSVAGIALSGGTLSACGGNGSSGSSAANGGNGGNGGNGIECTDISVTGGTFTATGARGGSGGSCNTGHTPGTNGETGCSAVIAEGGRIIGEVSVKNADRDDFFPLPEDECIGNYMYAQIEKDSAYAAPVLLNLTSIRTSGTPGLRFAAYVTDAQREACSSYGFLVARENDDLKTDPTHLVFNDAHSASGTNDHGVTYTSGEAYNKANGIDKTYADDGTEFGMSDVEATFFTGVMQGIPKAFYAENLIARPYMVIDGVTLYGETCSKSLYTNACAIRDGGYQGLDEDGIAYINSIISAVDKEAEIDVGGLTE